MIRTVLVAGGTGLIGKSLIEQLCADAAWDRVVHVGRRSCGIDHPKLTEHLHPNLADAPWSELRAQAAFCCLGTTMARAGSKEAFYAVDYTLCLQFGQLALGCGATTMCLVSSLGADAGSGNYYLRVKGETERDIKAMGFASTFILQPSLLMGNRSEQRPGERAAQAFMSLAGPLFLGPLKRYKGILADDVARAMVRLSTMASAKSQTLLSDQIQQCADGHSF